MNRGLRNSRRKNGLVWLTCPVCESEFMRTHYDVSVGRALCCSDRCKRVRRDIEQLDVVMEEAA